MRKYYVYVYRHPITKLPFYVGKGSGNRMFKHLRETFQNTENRKKYAIIQGLRNKGLVPIIGRYAKNLTEIAAYEIEKSLIKRWGRAGIDENGLLVNVCIDNRPPSAIGRKMPEEQRQKLKERIGSKNPMFGKKQSEESKEYMRKLFSGENNPFYGKTHSEKTRKTIAENNVSLHGRKRSDATKERMSISQLGKTVSDATKDKLRISRAKQTIPTEAYQRAADKRRGKPHVKRNNVWTFIDENGNKFETYSLKGFCEEKGLNPDYIRSRENTGKHAKGWLVTKVKLSPS